MHSNRVLWLCFLSASAQVHAEELAAHSTAGVQELTGRAARILRHIPPGLDHTMLRKGPSLPVCCACTVCDGCSSVLGNGKTNARRLGTTSGAARQGTAEADDGEEDDLKANEKGAGEKGNADYGGDQAAKMSSTLDKRPKDFFYSSLHRGRKGGLTESPGLEAWEEQFWSEGFQVVAGTDEAGRGTIAGPVVSAAFAVIAHDDEEVRKLLARIDGSKQLSAQERDEVFDQLTDPKFKGRFEWAIAEASAAEIDKKKISGATLDSMAEATRKLKVRPDIVLVDGPNRPPELLAPGEQKEIGNEKRQPKIDKYLTSSEDAHSEKKASSWRPRRVEAVIDGDALVPSIAAASVLAKVHFDRIAHQLHKDYPLYGFDSHKGYPTKQHLAAIRLHGVTPQHRVSFPSVQDALAGSSAYGRASGGLHIHVSNTSSYEDDFRNFSARLGALEENASRGLGKAELDDHVTYCPDGKDCGREHAHMKNASSDDSYYILDHGFQVNSTSPADAVKPRSMDKGSQAIAEHIRTWSLAAAQANAKAYKHNYDEDHNQRCCNSCAALAATPADASSISTAVLIGLFAGSGATFAALRSSASTRARRRGGIFSPSATSAGEEPLL